MTERHELLRQHARDLAARLHLVDLLGRSLEQSVAKRSRMLAHAAEQRGEACGASDCGRGGVRARCCGPRTPEPLAPSARPQLSAWSAASSSACATPSASASRRFFASLGASRRLRRRPRRPCARAGALPCEPRERAASRNASRSASRLVAERRILGQLRRALRFADPLGVFLLVLLQCEVIEHLAAREELLLLRRARARARRAARWRDRREPRRAACASSGARRRRRRAGRRAARGGRGRSVRSEASRKADHVVFEQRGEQVLQQRGEMRQKDRALLASARSVPESRSSSAKRARS